MNNGIEKQFGERGKRTYRVVLWLCTPNTESFDGASGRRRTLGEALGRHPHLFEAVFVWIESFADEANSFGYFDQN
jgi:hypothetical protein